MTNRARKQKEVITITILPLGGMTKEVSLEKGATVADALKAAEMSYGSSTEVRVNGEVLEGDMEVNDGESLIVSSAGKIEGGK